MLCVCPFLKRERKKGFCNFDMILLGIVTFRIFTTVAEILNLTGV